MTDTTDQYTRKLKYNAFMGTIAVCVIYAIVALAMILYINLTEQGKSLYSDLKPFALTFIFGTLFIIMAVTLMVVYWEPEQATKKEISDVLNNPLSCPDYYTLDNSGADNNVLFDYSCNISIIGNDDPTHKNLYIGNKEDLNGKFVNLYDYAITENNKDYIKHKCIKDPAIIPDFDKDDRKKTREVFWADSAAATTVGYTFGTDATSAGFKSTELKNLKTLAAFTTMYGGYNNENANIDIDTLKGNTNVNIITPIGDGGTATGSDGGDTSAPLLKSGVPTTQSYYYDCSKVYPEYLARLDAKEYIDNNETGPKNLHRCGWANACGVPWTSAGCS